MKKYNSNSKNRELAYNGVGSGGGGGGSTSIKTFTYTADGTEGANIELPSDCHMILAINSLKTNGVIVAYNTIPIKEGRGAQCGAYFEVNNDSGALIIGYEITGNNLVITAGADAGAKLYEVGQVSTFYYI